MNYSYRMKWEWYKSDTLKTVINLMVSKTEQRRVVCKGSELYHPLLGADTFYI